NDQSVRMAALTVLAVVWPDAPQTATALIRGSRDTHIAVRTHVLSLASARWPDSRRTARLLRRATRDLAYDVQIAAHDLGGVSASEGTNSKTSPEAAAELTRHPNAARRLDALRTLVLGAPTHPDTITAACRMVTDDSYQIRTVALTALSRHAATDASTVDVVV